MAFSPLIDRLIQAFCCLPGVGPKSAQRMVLYLLERNREGATILANSITEAVGRIRHCQQCHNLSESDICQLCLNPSRDASTLCVVETPADALAVEQSGCYRGLYYVLMGRLSPLDGIGPKELGIHALIQRLAGGTVKEVILATNPTVEGEATAHYLAQLSHEHHIKTTRIAHGVPLGGELEFIDSGTLVRAFMGRETIPI